MRRPAMTIEGITLAIKERRMQLGLSQHDVDYLAGLPDGYTGKIEASLTNPTARNARSLGRESLPLLLGALKLQLVIEPASDKAQDR